MICLVNILYQQISQNTNYNKSYQQSKIRRRMKRTVSVSTCTSILILSVFIFSALAQTPDADEVIISIPGYPYKFYSGYLDISVSQMAKSIHYVYFESQNNIAKDPIIVYLAGGPGCSGLVHMLQQNGPFIITPGDQRFTLNQHSWNKRAGLIYLEGPAGVGYSESISNQTITDEIATLEMFNAVRLFLDRHANLKKNELYIAGSGYGATIAAHVTRMIINSNKDESLIFWSKINVKGLLLGNPCIYPGECYASGSERNSLYHYEFLYNRGFMPKKWYLQLIGKCMIPTDPYSCYVVRQRLDKEFNATNTSAYNIYAKCYNNTKPTLTEQPTIINRGCQDQVGIIQYLNDPQHRRNWNIKSGKNWMPCNITIWNEYHSGNGSYHLLRDLIKDNMRLWVYSGDMDSTVPITGTKTWLNHFKTQYEVPIRKNWREWWIPGRHKGEDQVGGFIWELEGLTAVLVKGAGFKATFDQPVSMEIVINGFLDGKTLPYQA